MRAKTRWLPLSALFVSFLLVGAVCATAPASEDPEPFTLPVLTMKELHSLMDQTIAAKGDSVAQPLAIAQILCGAKGYNPGGAKFAVCRKRLSNAALAKPGILAKAHALARIAETLAATRKPKRRQPGGTISEKGRPTPCYDLSSAQLIICEDI
jgi:hypothetical protein